MSGYYPWFRLRSPKFKKAGVAMSRLFESGLFIVLVFLAVSIAAVFTSARAMSNQDVSAVIELCSNPLQLC